MYGSTYAQRIVCLTEEGTEILYAIGEQHRLVGISGFTYRPPIARKEKPKVSTFLDAKFDAIIALQPDLVIGYSDLQADLAAELIRRGIEVYIFNHYTVQGILDFVLRFTSLIGEKDKGQALLTVYQTNIQQAQKRAESFPQKPRVFFEEWYDPIMAGVTWVNELIEIAGGELIFPEMKGRFLAKDRILLPEQVVERNPDIIIGSWCGKMFKPETVRNRPNFSEIKAVQTNQLHEIKSEFILQPGPAALTDGLAQLETIMTHYNQ